MRWLSLLLAIVVPLQAIAQDDPPPDWPDPGSEEPGGPKLFPPDRNEKEELDDTDVDVPKSVSEPVYRWSWYGWRNLIGDGAAIVLGISAFASQRFEPAIAGAIVYALGGPIAHFTVGNWGRALISFGLRIAGPTIFGLGFAAPICSLEEDCGDEIGIAVIFLGAAIGGLVAAGLDNGLVARRKVEVEPKVAITPLFNALPNGPKTVGLAVQF
jgi:hypothetical protein